MSHGKVLVSQLPRQITPLSDEEIDIIVKHLEASSRMNSRKLSYRSKDLNIGKKIELPAPVQRIADIRLGDPDFHAACEHFDPDL